MKRFFAALVIALLFVGSAMANSPVRHRILTNTGDPYLDAQGKMWNNRCISNMHIQKNGDTGMLSINFDFDISLETSRFLIKLYDKNNVLLSEFYSEQIYKIYSKVPREKRKQPYPTELAYAIPQNIIRYVSVVEFGLLFP